MQIPWAALGRQQVQVEIDRLYVLAVPSYLQEGSAPESADAEEERLTTKKRADVAAAEQSWLTKMHSMDEAGAVASQPGYLQGVANVVLGNLKVKITNLHIRYEDCITRVGSNFACGITLHHISASTVDELGKEIFVKQEAMALLRKAAALSRFTVYFDTGACRLLQSMRGAGCTRSMVGSSCAHRRLPGPAV